LFEKVGLFFVYIYFKANNKNVETMKTSNKTSKLRSKDTTSKIKKNNGFDAALLNLGIKFIPTPNEK
jgi:hypothetical protein